ncbi:MAG: M15 family metallopeptidase [Methylovirgula sp.]|jgi:hypothetical protein
MRNAPFCSGLLIAAIVIVGAPAAYADEKAALDRLVRAYPDQLATHDDRVVVWRDGTTMPVSDGMPDKSFDERLRNASLLDQLLLPYPKGPLAIPPSLQDDPGRFRNEVFFDKMYGNCEKDEVQKHLVTIAWLPKSWGGHLKVTEINGVATKLQAISAELDALPLPLRKYAFPSAGTFNCRSVKDTGKRSMHAYGAAIDLNIAFSDYWLWRPHAAYRNRIPYEIVAIFERHGFIWGGKWSHYDTMHFEYRPELF